MGFSDKVVIITGASAGIGAAIAVNFAKERAKVVLVARNEKRLKEVAALCKEHGVDPLIIIADVSKDSDIKKIINTTVTTYDKIDILINNAGIVDIAAIYEEKAMEVYDRIIATNLRSAVYLTSLAVKYLTESRGNIINISSIAAVDPISEGNFAYCVSKAGMDHFTRSIALDLAPRGIRVNTVNPGPVATNIVRNLLLDKNKKDEFWNKWAEYTALGRVSQPEEIADLVIFLASEKAVAITGSSYITDNGTLLKRNVKLLED